MKDLNSNRRKGELHTDHLPTTTTVVVLVENLVSNFGEIFYVGSCSCLNQPLFKLMDVYQFF